jgi:glycosyltransferase involved in cell wall biosynthesis
MARLIIQFTRYGPYHHARLRSARQAFAGSGWEVIGLEVAGTDETYAWDEVSNGGGEGTGLLTVFPGRVYEQIAPRELRRGMLERLDAVAADAVVIAGWGSVDARTCLAWCRRRRVPGIVMSETRAADGHRVWWKEQLKRLLIARYDGALVGGASHKEYLISLGMRSERIHTGYNVVDNGYFAAESARYRSAEPTPQQAYFLASNRFIERKNLTTLISAYAGYVRQAQACATERPRRDRMDAPLGHGPSSAIWPLVLLGDGELKSTLFAKCIELGLTVIKSAPWETAETRPSPSATLPAGTVYFPGFRQLEELPRFFAHAGCFVHPALEEPWGLVINEAMACGLPILSSRNVGAAEELVVDGVNGWLFNATDMKEIRDCLLRVSAPGFPSAAFAASSRQLLENRAPLAAFGDGLRLALGGLAMAEASNG